MPEEQTTEQDVGEENVGEQTQPHPDPTEPPPQEDSPPRPAALIFFKRNGQEYFIGRNHRLDVLGDADMKLVIANTDIKPAGDGFLDKTRHFVGATLEKMIAGDHWDNPICWEPPQVEKPKETE